MKFNKIKVSVFCSLIYLMCSSLASFGQKPDFTGVWLMNEQRSEFNGESKETMFRGLKVNQTNDSLVVSGIRFNGDNTYSKSISFPFNGNPVTQDQSNNRRMTAIIHWSADGKILIRNSSYSFENEAQNYQSREIWALSDTGKILILTRTFIRANGNITIKAVYEKQ